jgi:hypothetical protein
MTSPDSVGFVFLGSKVVAACPGGFVIPLPGDGGSSVIVLGGVVVLLH